MGRLAWSQARFRRARTFALLAGMLVAATAFTVLTAAARTAQLRTIGTVSANFEPAYDILVRPKGARTGEETTTDMVQPDFLSGIYGGITMAQYRRIQQIPGVQVAAPIAMVGYAQLEAATFVPLPAAALSGSGRQIYRVSTTWVSDDGASRVTQPPSYLYVTPLPLTGGADGAGATDGTGRGCALGAAPVRSPEANPFGAAAQSQVRCWSRVNDYDQPGNPRTQAGYWVDWTIPVLIAAVDPDAEAKLDGLNKALVSGSYLTEDEGDSGTTFPVLASDLSGMNEYARTAVQRLAAPSAMPDMNAAWASAEASVPGDTVAATLTTAQQAYASVLDGLGPDEPQTLPAEAFPANGNPASTPPGSTLPPSTLPGSTVPASTAVTGYWSVGPVEYEQTASGALTPRQQVNPATTWYTGTMFPVAMDDEDSQYRTVTSHTRVSAQAGQPAGGPLAVIRVDGVFAPSKIASFGSLSQVPLGIYQPVIATPSTAASRQALHGSYLMPSQNVGGLVSQPVNLITTLSALPTLENAHVYSGVHAADPISVIRVRVAGVTGPGALSRERIEAVAQQIEQRTGLDMDIVAGSSPSPVTIDLPAGTFGQPSLTLSENWVKEGVAVAILDAVDKQSVALFTLILLVCVLFVANAATAAVRGRRRELGVLAAVGWRRSSLFATVLGELAGIGFAAGALAAALALPVSAALGLRASPGRALLAVPVAMAVAVIGGLVPAWLAARADPVSSFRPPAVAFRRTHQPRGITSLALLNVTRAPGRALIGVVSLAVGIAALTMLTAVTVAFRGEVVGSLLGDAVEVQVRGVDFISAGATAALGTATVADVVFLNIRERAAELATMRSFGWRDSALARLVITEGAIIGVAGSLAGAGIGLAVAAGLAGQLPGRLLAIAAVAGAAGIVISAAATLPPAALLRRLPAAHLLAEE
jgi:hypothetical protein